MPDPCLFCRIAAGEIPAHLFHEDADVLAFLDLHPIGEGHALVVPRAHHRFFDDLPPELAARVMQVSQTVSRRMKAAFGVKRVGLFFTGIHVPHAHAHLVPMRHPHDVSSRAYLADGPDAYTVPPSPPAADLARTAALLRETDAG